PPSLFRILDGPSAVSDRIAEPTARIPRRASDPPVPSFGLPAPLIDRHTERVRIRVQAGTKIAGTGSSRPPRPIVRAGIAAQIQRLGPRQLIRRSIGHIRGVRGLSPTPMPPSRRMACRNR